MKKFKTKRDTYNLVNTLIIRDNEYELCQKHVSYVDDSYRTVSKTKLENKILKLIKKGYKDVTVNK